MKTVELDRSPWSAETFEDKLRACESRYHIHHPFNQRLNRGELQPFQVRAWVANRFYYQVKIPQKDAAVLSNCNDRAERCLARSPGGHRLLSGGRHHSVQLRSLRKLTDDLCCQQQSSVRWPGGRQESYR